jgi:ATP-binding cassette subfamily C protein/ATP-binding cassette subfamily C protein EexD
MPQGYDTPLVQHGANLSGGQRQRVGLARAIYGKPSLLVLDEPDSHLDARGDHALNEAIRVLKEAGTTIVIVAHRPSLMRHVDRIVVLDEGRLQMHGPKAEVLANLQRPGPDLAKAS